MNLKKHLQYAKSDFRGELAFLCSEFCSSIISLHSKMRSCFIFLILNIKQGRQNKYIGTPWIKRFQNSSIIIGSRCIFVSKQTANPLGLKNRCMISTHASAATIQIGNNCSFSGVSIAALKSIQIGEGVRCGANVTITDSDWHSDDPRSAGSESVVIEDNVWLGANTIVLKGVTVGKNSLIGANSVVVKSIPPNVIAAGNPCKVIKQMDDQMIKRCDEYASSVHY